MDGETKVSVLPDRFASPHTADPARPRQSLVRGITHADPLARVCGPCLCPLCRPARKSHGDSVARPRVAEQRIVADMGLPALGTHARASLRLAQQCVHCIPVLRGTSTGQPTCDQRSTGLDFVLGVELFARFTRLDLGARRDHPAA